MDYLGFWKIKKVMMLGDDDENPWKTIEQALESDSIDDDSKKFLTDRFMFNEDGTVKVLEPFKEGVTQQDIDEAVAAGIIEVYDNLLVVGLYHWKEEGGKVFVDSGFGGGEPDWGEVTETDGMLNFLTYKLVRE